MPLPARIALLGLGIMGEALGERLLETGFALNVWNRTAQKAQALGARCKIAVRPGGAAHDADVVALCLTDKQAVEAVLFGDGGVAAKLSRHTLILDFSTLGIAATKDFAARIAQISSCEWWMRRSLAGRLQHGLEHWHFCGGTQNAIARATPVLDAVSRVHTHMGAVGAGQADESCCNQLIVSTSMIAIGEAIAVARRWGWMRAPAKALAGGYADCLPCKYSGPRMASRDLAPRISQVATMRKDVKEIAAAVADLPLDLRLTLAIEGLYDLAVERGLAEDDLGVLERLADRQS